MKELEVWRTHFDGKTKHGLRTGEALIEAVTGEVVSLCGHPEKDMGSSIREVDQSALGKEGWVQSLLTSLCPLPHPVPQFRTQLLP